VNYKEQLAAALKRAGELSKAAGERDLTEDELTEVKSLTENIDDLKGKVKAADDGAQLLKQLGDLGKQVTETGEPEKPEQAKSLGDHFIKHAGQRMKEIRGVKGASASAPEFKASSDSHSTGGTGGVFGPYLTEIDTNIVTGVRRRLTIADLLGAGTISGQAISYFVEGALEGDFTTVAEGGAKPQLHYAAPTSVTEALKKIAGFIKETDEMMEDLDFVVSAINGRLLYNLGLFEEDQILSGNGTGTNLKGILNRAGIGTVAATTDVSGADNADAVFRAITKVQADAGLDADGIVINPADYQAFRLSKDSNGQYFGGGFFSGQYGNGGIMQNPPLWGLRTVVTPAITSGIVLVGAYAQAATLYRKGGVRVESTNSHDTDFTNNLVTIRAEERVALAVRRPAGFVKVTLDYDGS